MRIPILHNLFRSDFDEDQDSDSSTLTIPDSPSPSAAPSLHIPTPIAIPEVDVGTGTPPSVNAPSKTDGTPSYPIGTAPAGIATATMINTQVSAGRDINIMTIAGNPTINQDTTPVLVSSLLIQRLFCPSLNIHPAPSEISPQSYHLYQIVISHQSCVVVNITSIHQYIYISIY